MVWMDEIRVGGGMLFAFMFSSFLRASGSWAAEQEICLVFRL